MISMILVRKTHHETIVESFATNVRTFFKVVSHTDQSSIIIFSNNVSFFLHRKLSQF